MAPNVPALATPVWGDARLVDDIHWCRMPESTGAEPSAVAAGTDDHPLWRDFKEAEAALDAAGEAVKGPVPDTHPAWPRWQAARDAIVNARATNLRTLAAQVRLFNDVMIGSDSNDDERRMMAHVAEQLSALAAKDAAIVGWTTPPPSPT